MKKLKSHWYKILPCLLILTILAGILIKSHGIKLNAAEGDQKGAIESTETSSEATSEVDESATRC